MGRSGAALLAASAFTVCTAWAQVPAGTPPTESLSQVQVSGEARIDREQKSVAQFVKAQQAFEKFHSLAPQASLRFRVYARRREEDLHDLKLELVTDQGRQPVVLEEDQRFALDPSWRALGSDAVIRSKLPDGRLAWHPDVRTPGLPPNTRRLGDLRLECKVDLYGAATLIRGLKPPAYYAAVAITDVCAHDVGLRYGWFADKPVFRVTLVQGNRREPLSYEHLHGSLAGQDGLLMGLLDWPYNLRDRLYDVPIFDDSWSDDAWVVFESMDDAPGAGS